MRYDSLGFPIPTDFDAPSTAEVVGSSVPRGNRRSKAGPWKRVFLAVVLLGMVGPAVFGPAVLPVIREVVVQWSLEQAIASEGRGALAAAIVNVSRAIRWTSGSSAAGSFARSRLLCLRAMLRIKNLDAAGGIEDANLAAGADPTNVNAQQVRALASVVLGQADAALAAAEAAVVLAGPDDPESLNHRAYIRALVGRELEAALTDIERALAASGPTPEFLDTRGYILHLLGRHHESIDDLNVAIDSAQNDRRRLVMLAGHVAPDELAYRLRHADHSLAVMHHHRGLACGEAGLAGQAEQDLAIALQKGFDPSRGIF